MAEWHLNELENIISVAGWKITKRLEGDGYKFSGIWQIERASIRTIVFNGLDDLAVLPMNKAYGCQFENSEMSIYFYQNGEQWQKELDKFGTFLKALE